jgi:crotonobetainyl-CoA:carnitine CoA-transferase CaiB-like acyl-CoA transferase
MDLNTLPFTQPLPVNGGIVEGSQNPFMSVYKTRDDRPIQLCVLTPGPYIQDTFEHLHLDHLMRDERFNTPEALMANANLCAPYIAEAFACHSFSYWTERLRTMKGQWAVYQNSLEVAQDPQVLANGMIYEVESADGGPPIRLVANPVQFDGEPVSNTRGPEANEHTELFLMDLGLDWERITALKDNGAIA